MCDSFLNPKLTSLETHPTWRPRGLSKWVISRVISTLNGDTPIITLLITDLLSLLGLQVRGLGLRFPLLRRCLDKRLTNAWGRLIL